ncbi:MAG TPA: GTPase [Bacillota bacterium]|nr:GTPase [Bacillota bacterium]
MASTNQSPQYQKAESKFLDAQTDEERIRYLEEMIRECPKHKSSEKMLANLKTRYKKLKEKLVRMKKSGKGKKEGIRKEEMQAIIVGFTNSGKSSLLSILTNAKPTISDIKFSTTHPLIGMVPYAGTQIQLIENPAIDSEFYDKGIVHTADTLLVLISDLKDLEKIRSKINSKAKQIIVFNKIDNLNEAEKRKISANLQSKKYNFVLISTKTNDWLEELKNKLFQSFGKLRIFTKEPGKERSQKPIILKPDSTIKDVAEKILKGFSDKVKEIRIWGPSSKFPGQIVGLNHELKDLDVVEFKTR